MGAVQRQTFVASALAAWNNPYLLHENPSRIDSSQIHLDIPISQQMTKQAKCLSPESKCLISITRSRTPHDSRALYLPEQSLSINKVAKDNSSTSIAYEICSLSSPTDTSAFEVPTPPCSPTPPSGKRQWTQKFTSRADAVSQEVLAFVFDEEWSPAYEISPAFNDKAIPCRLPATRKKSKITRAEAFDELNEVFRDVDVDQAKPKCLSPLPLLSCNLTGGLDTQTNEDVPKVLYPKAKGAILQDPISAPISSQFTSAPTSANHSQPLDTITLTYFDITHPTYKYCGKGRKLDDNCEEIQQPTSYLISPF